MSIEDLKSLIASEVRTALQDHLKPPAPLKVFTLKEAAELIGVHFHTVRLYAEKGKIESFKVGNRVYLTLEAIQNFIARGGSDKPTQAKMYK